MAERQESYRVSRQRNIVYAHKDGFEFKVWRIAARNNNSTGSPALVHVHGGAFICRHIQDPDPTRFRLKQLGDRWLQNSDVVLLYVDYRLATEKPFPAAFDDVYAALKWAVDEDIASELRIDRHRVGLSGVSAGGYLALAAAVKARDENLSPAVCAQMLIYPMVDPNAQWSAPFTWHPWRLIRSLSEKRFLRSGMECLPSRHGQTTTSSETIHSTIVVGL